jgi:hypothetical protein
MKKKSERSIAMVVTKVRLGSEEKAAKYWRTQSYQARLAALEQIRQEYHNWKKDAQPGFQRVYTIVKQ